MIGVNKLVDCVNVTATTITEPLEILQLSSVSKDFDTGFVSSVANLAALPTASTNTGRFIYVQDIGDYRFSNGVSWTTDVTSVINAPNAYSWGRNAGQLGEGTNLDKSSPVSIVGGFTDWCQISAGTNHGLGVRTNGTAWAWGFSNSVGLLGDNSTVNRSSPVSVLGGFTDWCQVSAGCTHSLGVRTNGTAWAWGRNNAGQLGDDTTVNKSSPVSVVGGFTDWCQVSAGQQHSLGVRTNGTAWAWGYNGGVIPAVLGDGTTVNKSSPVSVIGGFTDWCQVSAGWWHSLGLRSNGTAWAWGRNNAGLLGDNTTIIRSSPVSVVGGFTDWCQLSAANEGSLGVRTNGTAWGWGCNGNGRLGNSCTANTSSPVSVVGGFTDWCQVDGGSGHTLGLRSNGSAWAWGGGFCGRLGDGTTVDKSSPVLVVGGFTDWCQVSAGCAHSHGLRAQRGF